MILNEHVALMAKIAQFDELVSESEVSNIGISPFKNYSQVSKLRKNNALNCVYKGNFIFYKRQTLYEFAYSYITSQDSLDDNHENKPQINKQGIFSNVKGIVKLSATPDAATQLRFEVAYNLYRQKHPNARYNTIMNEALLMWLDKAESSS